MNPQKQYSKTKLREEFSQGKKKKKTQTSFSSVSSESKIPISGTKWIKGIR